MKIALIAAGQPRFTPDFIEFMHQLHGFNQGDFYFNFWTTPEWAGSVEEGSEKIQKILPPQYRLAKLQIVDQPAYDLPPHKLQHPPAQPENINWWYKRRVGLWQSLQLAFNLIDQEYDAIVRFRPDGCLFEPLDISKVDLVNNDLIFPDYARNGFEDFKICDLFSIGTYEGMKFYCNMADHFRDLVPVADPKWELNGHGTWSPEHVFAVYMKMNNRQQVLGDFKFHINRYGRSRFTDKHYHHQIVPDPTNI